MNDPQKPGFHVFTIRYPYVIFEQRPWQPFINVCETDQSVVIIAELAGVDPQHVQIDVEPNLVRIQGGRQVSPPAHMQRLHRMEIASGPFQIEVPLNIPVDPERAESRYNQGLLEVILPLARRPAQRVVIPVTDGDAK